MNLVNQYNFEIKIMNKNTMTAAVDFEAMYEEQFGAEFTREKIFKRAKSKAEEQANMFKVNRKKERDYKYAQVQLVD